MVYTGGEYLCNSLTLNWLEGRNAASGPAENPNLGGRTDGPGEPSKEHRKLLLHVLRYEGDPRNTNRFKPPKTRE
jgi:hypothetical protein